VGGTSMEALFLRLCQRFCATSGHGYPEATALEALRTPPRGAIFERIYGSTFTGFGKSRCSFVPCARGRLPPDFGVDGEAGPREQLLCFHEGRHTKEGR